jgi:hypothetical protein
MVVRAATEAGLPEAGRGGVLQKHSAKGGRFLAVPVRMEDSREYSDKKSFHTVGEQAG